MHKKLKKNYFKDLLWTTSTPQDYFLGTSIWAFAKTCIKNLQIITSKPNNTCIRTRNLHTQVMLSKSFCESTKYLKLKSFYKGAKNPTVRLAEPNFIQLLLWWNTDKKILFLIHSYRSTHNEIVWLSFIITNKVRNQTKGRPE